MKFIERGFSFIILLIAFSIVFTACEKEEERQVRLAKQYCSSCHIFPEPGLLDKKSWSNSVLPRMGML